VKRQPYFIGRQPIVNRDGDIFGFELLYRDSEHNHAVIDDADIATARLVATAYMDFGIEYLVGSRMAFINVSPAFLTGDMPLPLPPEQVAVEVREGVTIDRRLVDGLRQLRRRGFTIVVDRFEYRADSAPLLTVAHYAKLDLRHLDDRALRDHMRHLDLLGVKVIAERVESEAELERARRSNVPLFQGFHIGPPEVLRSSLLPLRDDVAALLARLVAWPEPDLRRIVRVLVQDPIAIFRLLRFVNIATFAGRGEIRSVEDAVNQVGPEALSDWARLLQLAGLPYPDGRPMARDALLRARISALLAERTGEGDPGEAFLAGLLFGMEKRLGMEREDFIDALPVTMAIKLALLDGSGPLGRMISAADERPRPHPRSTA
jgi:EAL and modified HD-GYP domain-containing signal transduction protein